MWWGGGGSHLNEFLLIHFFSSFKIDFKVLNFGGRKKNFNVVEIFDFEFV